MQSNQKRWNQQLQTLRRALSRPADHPQAIKLFLSQHAMVHSAKMSAARSAGARSAGAGLWSFEDEVWQGVTEKVARCIPKNGEHSMVWCLWHIARIEDITMNLLVAGTPQIAQRGNWFEKMKLTVLDTGNAMDAAGVAQLSATLDVKALRAYRVAVGRRTREIVKRLAPDEISRKVDPARLQRVLAEGAVVEAAQGLLDYWGKRTIAGLLLMPATRHPFVHLNEMARIKQKCS